jgi:hypothetical protein
MMNIFFAAPSPGPSEEGQHDRGIPEGRQGTRSHKTFFNGDKLERLQLARVFQLGKEMNTIKVFHSKAEAVFLVMCDPSVNDL